MITAEKAVGKDGREWIKVSFKNVSLFTERMKTVNGAVYSEKHKMWAVPGEYRSDFEEKMGDFLIHWVGEEELFGTGGIDESTIPDQPIVPGYSVQYETYRNSEGELARRIVGATGFKTPPWGEFQVKGFNLLCSRDFLILADDAGLGKTWQVSTAIEARKKLGHLRRGLVLAKASLLYNWRDEILLHTNLKPVVVAGTERQRDRIYEELRTSDDWTFIIMSYETYREDAADVDLLDNYKPLDFLILDEAHKIKNPTSKLGTVVHRLPFKYKYVLTATPLPNSPLEAYNYLRLGGKVDINWWQFRHRYAIFGGYGKKEVIGYKNMNELRYLIQSNMLRRLKRDKLKELPEVSFKTIAIEMTSHQAKIYKAIKEEIMEDLRDTSLRSIPSALSKLLRLQQVTDSTTLIGDPPSPQNSAKILALDELLEDLIGSGQKVIVFSRFRSMVEILEQRYQCYNPAVVHGEVDSSGYSRISAIRALRKEYGSVFEQMSREEREALIEKYRASDRQKEVYKFQSDPTCKLFLGCSSACREGLTLTQATHVIFVDCEWSPAYVEQAYSRAHRIGQKNAVTVYYLVCKGTIDEHVQKVLATKNTLAQLMLDAGIDSVGQQVARELIASMIGEHVA